MEKDFTCVYIAKIPEKIGDISEIFPISRREYILDAKNGDVRRARYFVWRLLSAAIARTLGMDIKDLDFSQKDGRWSTSAAHISLSHGGGYAAVALSNAPVGIDVEPSRAPRAARFAERILTDGELKAYADMDESIRNTYLLKAWSKKEAIFKSLALSAFIPQKIDTGAYSCEQRVLSYPDCELILSVACKGDFTLQICEENEI